MNRLSTLHYLLISVLCLISCHTKFNKTGWTAPEDPVFPPDARASMLDDLVENHQLVGLTCAQLRMKLGHADYKDSSTMMYKVDVKYEGIDPTYSKSLVFTYTKDSIVRKFNIVERNSE